jgi:hypothetical protein
MCLVSICKLQKPGQPLQALLYLALMSGAHPYSQASHTLRRTVRGKVREAWLAALELHNKDDYSTDSTKHRSA